MSSIAIDFASLFAALGTTLVLQIVALPALLFFTRNSRKG